MSNTDNTPVIYDVGEALIDDIERDVANGGYDRFIFFTYSIKEDYLRYFSDRQEVMFCGGNEVIDTIDRSDSSEHIRAHPIESHKAHAKIYLMWNEHEMKCWLGSFNFTRRGIHLDVEWAIEETAPLRSSPSIDEVAEGQVIPTAVTGNKLLAQVVETIGAVLTHGEPDWTNDLRRHFNMPFAVVKNKPKSTLRTALAECLEPAEEEISLTYFTPFVSREGVYNLADAIPETLSPADLNVEIRTCRIEEMDQGDSTHLTEDDIAALEQYFRQFQLLARASGDSGNELADGRRLRSGFAHFKILFISYTDSEGEHKQHTVFTTANLTHEAWQPNPTSLEVGVWVRDQELNECFSDFYINQMQPCYVEPSDYEIQSISGGDSETTWFEERWLSDHIRDRLSVTGNQIALDWANLCWPVTTVTGRLHLRDVTTGERRSCPIDLAEQDEKDAFVTDIASATIQGTEIIQLIELDIETRLSPRELRVTDALLNEIRSLNTEQEEIVDEILSKVDNRLPQWQQLIWNGELPCSPGLASDNVPDTIESVWVRKERPEGVTRPLQISLEPDAQPHIGETFITDTQVASQTIDPLGTFFRVDIQFDPAVDPRHDMITFETSEENLVPYYGFISTENGYRYLFNTTVAGDQLKAVVQPPFREYYDEVEFTIPDTHTVPSGAETSRVADQLRKDPSYQFKHDPIDVPEEINNETDDLDEFITEGARVGVCPPGRLVSEADGQTDSFQYLWKRLTAGYRGPQVAKLDDCIVPRVPHSIIEYYGTVRVETENEPATLLTKPNRFDVYEQAFSPQIVPDSRGISDFDLFTLGESDPLLWLVFDSETLLREDIVIGPEATIKFSAWLDEKKLPKTRKYPVSAEHELFCIPLFGDAIGRDIALQLELRLSRTSGNYAANSTTVPISVRDERTDSQKLTVEWGAERKRRIPITHNPNRDFPSLHRFASKIRTKRLEDVLKRHDNLEVVEYGRGDLTLKAERPVILHLVPEEK